MKPFLKWIGNKQKLAPTLIEIIQSRLKPESRFFEPFLGSGSISLALAEEVENFFYLSDLCNPLIGTWKKIIEEPREVSRSLTDLTNDTSEVSYYQIRQEYNERLKDPDFTRSLDCASYFLYLNHLCYNGTHRENSKGEFNVPYGHRKKPSFPSRESLERTSQLLAGRSLISSGDYREILAEGRRGDFFCIDPPYDGVYNGYCSASFDQKELARILEEAAAKGILILAHNSNTKLIRDLYSWAGIQTIVENRSVGRQKKTAEKSAECVLISYFQEGTNPTF